MKIDNNTDYSSLFSSLGNNNNQSGFSLSDYADIKNGSYAKLMKAYYGKGSASSKASGADSKKLDETATKNMSAVQKSSGEFKDATAALSSAVSGGDSEKIYKAARDFADKYNSLMSDAGKVDNKTIKRTATNLMNEVASNLKLLNKAGIKMDDDGKMSVDEKSIKAEGNTALKALFDKNGSFADMVGSKASTIANRAQSAIKASGTYTAKATYNNQNVDLGSFYDSFN